VASETHKNTFDGWMDRDEHGRCYFWLYMPETCSRVDILMAERALRLVLKEMGGRDISWNGV
jgi:hypothetical protein